ncbi:non-specific serine/threonine protein kinase [Ranunculus cassubicifolius]
MQSKKSHIPPTPEPPSPKSSDLVLGKYKLGRLLGRGSFAKVFSAQSVNGGPSVAIKIIDKSILLSAGMETQIVREVAVMHRLNHPNIVRIHEVMATKSKIYLVMEYVRGGDLFTKIARKGRLSEAMAKRYFQQLVTTIQYCHVKGVVHRDIKPQNLLLDQEGNLKVSDFGLAGLQEPVNNGLLQTACGTPAYTAPEVVGRKGYAGPKADAWSCGIILYVFLAGCIPFDDTNLMVMYRKIYKREFEFPPWFSKPVKRIISKLLDPNPDTRMSIEEVLESSWLKTSFQSVPNLCALDTPEAFADMKVDFLPRARTMNAFEIISMSSGLDLSPLFEKGKKNEKRFTSTSSHEKILERVEEAGGKLGYIVQRMEGGVIGLIKGRLAISVKVVEVAVSVFLVDLRIGDGEDVEMEDAYWRDLKAGLGDIVVCQNEPICSDPVVCQKEQKEPISRRTMSL